MLVPKLQLVRRREELCFCDHRRERGERKGKFTLWLTRGRKLEIDEKNHHLKDTKRAGSPRSLISYSFQKGTYVNGSQESYQDLVLK